MLFSPIDPLWVGLIVLVLFVLIYGLCYCLKLCVEAVKTGQKILTEQQESMSEKEKGLKSKKKKKSGWRETPSCAVVALNPWSPRSLDSTPGTPHSDFSAQERGHWQTDREKEQYNTQELRTQPAWRLSGKSKTLPTLCLVSYLLQFKTTVPYRATGYPLLSASRLQS